MEVAESKGIPANYDEVVRDNAEIQAAFDKGFKGPWQEWDAVDKFCDRLANSIFSLVDEKIRKQMDTQGLLGKGQLFFQFRQKEAHEAADSLPRDLHEWYRLRLESGKPVPPFYWNKYVEELLHSEEDLPVEERLFHRLLVNGKSFKYPTKGSVRQSLMKMIGDATIKKIAVLLEESEKTPLLQFKVRPLYRATKAANNLILLSLAPTVIGTVVYGICLDGRTGVKEKRSGPVGCEITWKVKFQP